MVLLRSALKHYSPTSIKDEQKREGADLFKISHAQKKDEACKINKGCERHKLKVKHYHYYNHSQSCRMNFGNNRQI
jgi:hypothetical protein